MQEIGTISYFTLEQGVETEWEALQVYQNKRERDFYFRNNNQLPPEIKRELPNLASCMRQNVKQFYRWYAPLFEDQDRFDEMVTEIVCARTFFERSDVFNKKHPRHKYAVGLFYHQSHSAPFGLKIIEVGSHLKIKKAPLNIKEGLSGFVNRSSVLEMKTNLCHEYAHEMHYQSSRAKITSDYDDYDKCMKEVIALNTERKIKKEEHHYPYYVRLVKRLEQISGYSELPFHEQWNYLLQFKTKRELVQHLKQNKV